MIPFDYRLFEKGSALNNEEGVDPEMSIAISLKRIADILETRNAYGEVGAELIANTITRAIREGVS